MARSIADPGPRWRALAAVAEALARTGEYERAESVARSIADPGPQARALVLVALAVADAGRGKTASQLAALACTLGRWTIVARAVLSLDDHAFVAIARAVGVDQPASETSGQVLGPLTKISGARARRCLERS